MSAGDRLRRRSWLSTDPLFLLTKRSPEGLSQKWWQSIEVEAVLHIYVSVMRLANGRNIQIINPNRLILGIA